MSRYVIHVADRIRPQFTWSGKVNSLPTIKLTERECTGRKWAIGGSFHRSGILGITGMKRVRCWVTSCFRILPKSLCPSLGQVHYLELFGKQWHGGFRTPRHRAQSMGYLTYFFLIKAIKAVLNTISYQPCDFSLSMIFAPKIWAVWDLHFLSSWPAPPSCGTDVDNQVFLPLYYLSWHRNNVLRWQWIAISLSH